MTRRRAFKREKNTVSPGVRRSREMELMMRVDIWYNKWAGGDREDSYGQYVLLSSGYVVSPLITFVM